jgi:hypothetical protein
MAASAIDVFNCVISRLARLREFDPEESCRFVFGDLASDSERLARQGSVFLRELLGLAKNFEDAILGFLRFEQPTHGVIQAPDILTLY